MLWIVLLIAALVAWLAALFIRPKRDMPDNYTLF